MREDEEEREDVQVEEQLANLNSSRDDLGQVRRVIDEGSTRECTPPFNSDAIADLSGPRRTKTSASPLIFIEFYLG